MKVFLDTNVLARYYVADNEKMFSDCRQLIETIESGSILPYSSSIVLLEFYYVLTSYYHISKKEVVADIETILQMRGITLIDKVDIKDAIVMYKSTHVKFTDCLIATQVGKGITLVTYDREFQKLPDLAVAEPGEVLPMVK